MIRVSGQSKSRPVKAAGAEVGAQRSGESKNCTPLLRNAHFEVKRTKHEVFGALFEVLTSKNQSGSKLVR